MKILASIADAVDNSQEIQKRLESIGPEYSQSYITEHYLRAFAYVDCCEKYFPNDGKRIQEFSNAYGLIDVQTKILENCSQIATENNECVTRLKSVGWTRNNTKA
jgi:hypothetical protein